MDKIIEVEFKEVYGNQLIYVRSEHKEALKTLTGKETINKREAEALKSLGFTFTIRQAQTI